MTEAVEGSANGTSTRSSGAWHPDELGEMNVDRPPLEGEAGARTDDAHPHTRAAVSAIVLSLADSVSALPSTEVAKPWDAQPRNLQDPLTFRTLPQVNGAARDTLGYAKSVLDVELNAHQGSPVVSALAWRAVSAGNFDVVPLAAALDFVRIALAPAFTSAAERALKLLQAPLTGLPEGLAARAHPRSPGLASSEPDPGTRGRGTGRA